MGNKIANRAVICEKLQEFAKTDQKICIVTSDSRGSASLTPFTKEFPDRVIEVGIAEQDLVGIAAGLAAAGMKPYVASPACFLTMRSIEQIKVDVAYSKTDVKLIGISAGVSYGALGMSHHSLQDIAVLNAIPNMTIIVPADPYETKKMMNKLADFHGPVYIRVGRNPVSEVYHDDNFDYEIGKAKIMHDGDDLSIVAYGERVRVALDAAIQLELQGIQARVINMHTIKPFDQEVIVKAAKDTKRIITIEEHSINGGLGSIVSQIVANQAPCIVKTLAIPDETLISGNSQQLFEYYGLTKENVVSIAKQLLKDEK